MARYSISGIWKDNDGVITHYAIHKRHDNGKANRAVKTPKESAIKLVEDANNTVVTWLWNYRTSIWTDGERVHVVNTGLKKYLRSNRDSQVTDNLNHLINYDWL